MLLVTVECSADSVEIIENRKMVVFPMIGLRKLRTTCVLSKMSKNYGKVMVSFCFRESRFKKIEIIFTQCLLIIVGNSGGRRASNRYASPPTPAWAKDEWG